MISNDNLKKANEFISFIASQPDIFKNFSYYIFKNKISYTNTQLLKDVYQDSILLCYQSIIKGSEVMDYLSYFYRSLRNNYFIAVKKKSKTISIEEILPNEINESNNTIELCQETTPNKSDKELLISVITWAKANLTKNEWCFFNEYYFINHQKKTYKQIAKEHNLKHREYVWKYVSSAKRKIKDYFPDCNY